MKNNFADNLKYLMHTHDMTQEYLARKLKVQRGSVSNWVHGRRTPSLDTLINISEIFEVTLDDLVKDEIYNK